MSSYDISERDSHQVSAAHTHMIAQISDLLLQACRLGPVQSTDQSSQIQQDGGIPRRRGRPKPGRGDPVVEQFAALCTAGHALICGLASLARLAVNRPVYSCLAYAQWPG
jgi:hypothetical protein